MPKVKSKYNLDSILSPIAGITLVILENAVVVDFLLTYYSEPY